MRIVYVAWHGSVHTRRWVSFFADRGHDVHVVTCGGADAADADTPTRRYRVYDLGAPRLGKLGYVLKLRRARRVIRDIEPEVVHAHFATSYGLLALWAGVRPLVVTAHGDDVLVAPRNPLLRAVVRRVLRAAKLVTVPSELMRQAVERLVGTDYDVETVVFQYGVETRRLQQFAAELRRADGAHGGPAPAMLRIVSARAMLRLYRLDALLDAVALLAGRGVDMHCELLGDGPERASLERQARQLGISDRVSFRGTLRAPEVERCIAASDIYVSVAESDGVSLALLEAMALGAVPVLSDIPANRSWINDGYTGVLVAIDALSIATGIVRAARLDRERVAADNAAVVAERADRETNLTACELLIDSLVGVVFERGEAVPDADTDGVDAA